jgi:Mce-associated membrane protein
VTTDQIIDPEVADVTETDDVPTTEPRTSAIRSRLTPILVATVVLLLVGAAMLAFLNRRHDDIREDADTARAVGVTHVEELLSFDHTRIDQEIAKEGDWVTGDFASEYGTLMADKIAPAAKKAGVVTQARVAAGGVESAERDEVELLLFVTILTTSKELAEPSTAGSRLLVTLRKVDGDWRISALDPV